MDLKFSLILNKIFSLLVALCVCFNMSPVWAVKGSEIFEDPPRGWRRFGGDNMLFDWLKQEATSTEDKDFKNYGQFELWYESKFKKKVGFDLRSENVLPGLVPHEFYYIILVEFGDLSMPISNRSFIDLLLIIKHNFFEK